MPDLVFASDVRTPLDDPNPRKVIRRIAQKAELRNTEARSTCCATPFGALLVSQGESLAYVKEQIGHFSIQITVDVYRKRSTGEMRNAARRNLRATKNFGWL